MNSPLKKLMLSVALSGLILLNARAQESCSQYYPTKVGVKYEMTSYDKKKRKTQVTNSEVVSFANDKATIHSVVKDLKKDKITEADFHVICQGDQIMMDLNEMMEEVMKAEMDESEDVSVHITGTDPVVPNNLEVGQSLPDAKSDIAISSGSTNFNFHVYYTDKKVVGMETITVPAGTFDCVVISMNSDTKMLISASGKSKQWIAEGVGLVKQEDYKKNGKKSGYQELTSIKGI